MPWRGKSIFLMSASPSPMGGIRGLWQTRIPLEGCGALVFPDMFALPHANQAFDDAGGLRDPALAERLRRDVVGFVRLAEAIAPVCASDGPHAARKRQGEIARALEAESELQPPSAPQR
jgi:NAD(P)H-dependent FMN reductase